MYCDFNFYGFKFDLFEKEYVVYLLDDLVIDVKCIGDCFVEIIFIGGGMFSLFLSEVMVDILNGVK